jgi:hypothetical protein
MRKKYPNVNIYETNLLGGEGKAITLPGLGIFIYPNKSVKYKTEVLQTEYGHILDFRTALDLNTHVPGVVNSSTLKFYFLI